MISDKSGASFFWNTGRICYSTNDPLRPDQQGKFSTFPNEGWPESGMFFINLPLKYCSEYDNYLLKKKNYILQMTAAYQMIFIL